MASIEKRILKSGERAYHITVCVGHDLNGKKVRRRTIYKPDPGLSEKQADKAAQKEAFRFEQQLEQGFVVEENQRFQEYAEYVMELKLRNGLKRSTYERYLTLLPKINDVIGTMRLRDIRPMHLNNFYGQLAKFSKRKGLPHINPHAFRHTAASVLIAQGTDVVTVSKMLGHTKVSTTEDIYSHVIEDCKQQASNVLAEVYFRRKTAEN